MLNPQQLAFKENYTNPNSETFGNAYRSALNAGFSDEYAKVITSPSAELQWVSEILNDVRRLQRAEKVLDKTLEMIDDEDTARQKLAQDSAKFLAKGLGKNKYSERQEMSGPEGGSIDINLSSLDDGQLDKLIAGIQASVGKSIVRETTPD
jgi:phage terminase small subunit